MFCAANASVVGWWIVISSKPANESGAGFVHQFCLMSKESLFSAGRLGVWGEVGNRCYGSPWIREGNDGTREQLWSKMAKICTHCS